VPERHSEILERAFTDQAAAFEDTRFNRLFTSDSQWIFERLPLSSEDLLLDVAAGTGHAARSLARSVRSVLAVDATPAMLATGQDAAAAEGLENIIFQLGDASALPFLDGSFDVVVCRFALHHFETPAIQAGEIARCLKAGGRVVVADLISESDPEMASRQNRLERMRDPSHTRMLSASELTALLSATGLQDVEIEIRHTERPLEPWLTQTHTKTEVAASIRAELEAELTGGLLTGFRPRQEHGALLFTQSFASVLAHKSV
jgi:ubiquinone/menaquinone biosynthesis C-methylase UbiE